MPREFELRKEVELQATPEQVWTAISTEAGMAAWFMPMPDVNPDSPIVISWDPPQLLATRTPSAPDGSTMAFEYLIAARDGGSTVLRFVHSGLLGDDWSTDYEPMTSAGWDMYLHTLAEYLKHFGGQRATYVEAEAPPASARTEAWPVLLTALGLAGEIVAGQPVRLAPNGLPPINGTVDYVHASFLGVRTTEALYRFHGRAALNMPIAVGHHLYIEGVDGTAQRQSWQSWLAEVFSADTARSARLSP